MSVEKLINIVRLGKQLTPALSRAVASQLERIPAMERTIAAKDRDFTQLSIAYTAAIQAGSAKCVQFTAEECQFVCDALEECEQLKDAERWERECSELWDFGPVITDEACDELVWSLNAARKAVEELL